MFKLNHIQYGNREIFFKIERSDRRKTVGIYVSPKAGVVVRAPRSLEAERIKDLIRKRAQWIITKQEFINTHSQLHPEKEFVSGESFFYLGRQYRLKVLKTASKQAESCKLMSGRFFIGIHGDLSSAETREAVKEALMGWYIGRAKEKIPERVELYARQIGKWPERIEIKDQKSRWGSCSRHGVVRFNWKIIMAPVTVLDYVIVHELCHLIHQSHSARFWQKVQTIIADYTMRRKRLREYSLMLSAFDHV